MCITFRNLSNSNIICKIDNQKISLKNDKYGNSFAKLELSEGKHILTVAKRSWYSTPICYLNIINPIYYIWQLRFLEHRLSKFDNSFNLIKITFEIFNKKDATLTFHISLIQNSENCDFLYCVSGIKNISVDKKLTDSLQKRRYKITHIFSSIFYMIFFNVLCIINCFYCNDKISTTLLFCILITFFSCIIIYQVMKT